MISVVVLVITMLAAQTAFAYYNPSTGQWLSRDPIGEPGFQTPQMAQGTSQTRPVQAARQASRWVSRGPVEEKGVEQIRRVKRNMNSKESSNLYLFVGNDPIQNCDDKGLSIADVANMYSQFVQTLKVMCICRMSCPEIGWMQNLPGVPYLGCTKQTEYLEDQLDKLKYEDKWDITVNFENSNLLYHHNSVRVKPSNPDDPVVDVDTWKGCFSATWPAGSSQTNFSKCFTCKELLK
jgi:hypothetical protein